MLQAPLFREHDIVTVLPSLSCNLEYSMLSGQQMTGVSPSMVNQVATRHAIACLELHSYTHHVYYRFTGDYSWYWVDCMTTEGMRIAKYLNLDFDVSSRRRIVG